ncbi:MAG: DUF2851 family protein [Flavobacteriales bacterium]|nr:DUF2851 family protein [Flavobacteriales bacterium]
MAAIRTNTSVPSKRHRATYTVARDERITNADVILDPAFPYGEDLLQFLWEAQLFDGRDLHTTDGRPVAVVRAGTIQHNSGPDLIDAAIRLEGQLWAGTVEVHLRASDWDRHGHQHDPAYNSVILHVVYQHDRDVRTVRGTTPPTVALSGRIDPLRVDLHATLMKERDRIPCKGMIQRALPPDLDGWLHELMLQRVERKAAGVIAAYDALGNDPAETLYCSLLQGFGLKVNAEAFTMLARSLPLRVLSKYRDDPMRVEALLFGQAGMLRVDLIDAYPRLLQQEYAALAGLHGLHPIPTSVWRFARMRPADLPTVRIAQFAGLFTALDGDLGGLLSTDDPDVLLARLDAGTSDHWNTHYGFEHASAPRAKRLGAATAERIIANTVVPYLYAMGLVRADALLKAKALRLLERLPPERNAITAEWESLGVAQRHAGQSQALIELRNLHCGQRACLSCVIGMELLRSPK